MEDFFCTEIARQNAETVKGTVFEGNPLCEALVIENGTATFVVISKEPPVDAPV